MLGCVWKFAFYNILSLCLFVHMPLLLFDYTACCLRVMSAKSERVTQNQ